VGVLAESIMNSSDSPISADMLLVRARQRRIQSGPGETVRPIDRAPSEAEEVLIADDDAILYPGPQGVAAAAALGERETPPSSSFTFLRPLAGVSLAGVAWSGAIDHAVLQDAIGCAPTARDARFAALLQSIPDRPLSGATRGEPALCVTISPGDLAFLDRALERADSGPRERLACAALLPDSLSDAPSAATAAAAHSLADYRSVALVAAWRAVMGLAASAESARELEASAARLLSTMRAFLGET
jgi:hypothetical protein